MIFNNVNLLGYQHSNVFWGDKSLRYASLKKISIKGYILDLANDNGVESILTDAGQIISESKSFQNVILNGKNFGTGKVKSLSVDPGNWVRYTEYAAEIEIMAEEPIEGIDSKEFSGISLTGKRIFLLQSFSENFSLNFNDQNKILSGEHSLDITYDADGPNVDQVKLAQALAVELLKTIPDSDDIAEGNYILRPNYKVLNSETYDTVKKKCGFRRTFEYSTLNTDKDYSIVRNHNLSIDQNGVATVSEKCTIKAENDLPSLYQNALTGYNEQISGVFARCNSVFLEYKTKFSISRSLNQHFISKSAQINKYTGVISFDVLFDNDPKHANQKYSWEYTSNLERDENGVWKSSEEGSIKGIGKPGSTQKYDNAEVAWTDVKAGIEGRIAAFYADEATDKVSGGTLKLFSKTINRNQYGGSIGYGTTYTDDPTIKNNDPDYLTKISVEKTDTGLMPIVKTFIIPNNKYSLVHNRNLKQQGSFTVKINMEVGCLPSDFNGYTFLSRAQQIATSNKPGGNIGNDIYLESASFTSDEVEKVLSYQVVYKYS